MPVRRGADGLQAGQRTIAAVGFGNTDQAGIGFQLDNRAQGEGSMPAIGAAQRRIGDGDRMENQISNSHGT